MLNIIKRVIVCLVALTFVTLSCALGVSEAVGKEQDESDEVLLRLAAFGLIDLYFDTDKLISRGEFAKLIYGLSIAETSSTADIYFFDVKPGHQFYKYINTAAELNLMNGDNNSNFRPDDIITVDEAVKVLVTVTGYENIALSKGGYPIGYMAQAISLGIYRGVTAESREKLVGSNAARLIYNTIRVPVQKMTSISKNEIKYSVDNNVTILSDLLDIEEKSGIVEANSITSITNEKGAGKGNVLIDGIIHQEGKTSAGDYVGRFVEYFVKVDEHFETSTVLYIAPHRRDNFITVGGEDILNSTTKTSVIYKNEYGREETLQISRDASVIYNGVYWTDINQITGSALWFTDENNKLIRQGSLAFSDYNNNGIYDVIFINEYSTIVVGSVIKEDYIIVDKYETDRTLVLDPNDTEYSFRLYLNGRPAVFDVIRVWSVLSVGYSKDRSFMQILISSDISEGSLDEIVSHESIIVGAREIKMSPYLLDMLSSNKISELRIGASGGFFVDALGYLAAIDFPATEKYTYLMNIIKRPGLSIVVEAKVYDFTGSINVYRLAERVTYRNTQYSAGDIVSLPPIYDNINNMIRHQLIKVEFNSNMEIKKIETAADYASDNYDYHEDEFSMDFKGNLRLKTSANPVFENKYLVGTETAFMIVPPYNEENPVPIQDSDIAVRNISQLGNDAYPLVEIYDSNRNRIPRVILARQGIVNSVSEESDVAVVTRKSRRLSSAGEEENVIYCTQKGAEIVLITDEKSLLAHNSYSIDEIDGSINSIQTNITYDDIQPGDVLQYTNSASGFLQYAERFFAYKKDNTEHFVSQLSNGGSGRGDQRFVGYVRVHAKMPYGILFNTELAEVNTRVIPFSGSNPLIYIYDSKNSTVKSSNINQIRDIRNYGNNSTSLFIRSRYNVISEVIIYD